MRTLWRRLAAGRVWIAGLVWLSTGLGGCGPGVGGTGTGEADALAYFGASALSICSADVGAVLGCTPGTATPQPGPTPVHLADATVGPQVQARVQDGAMALTVPCTGLSFRGEWGQVAGQAARYFGSTGPEGVLVPATLEVQASGTGVRVLLRDAQGAALLGPTLLQAVPAATAPGACG